MRTLPLLILLASCSRTKVDETADTGPYDNDLDGVVAALDCDDEDVDVGEESAWYLDSDGDGWGDSAEEVFACEAPSGYVADAEDCDDGNADIHPGAWERDCADPVDYNCDGSVGYEDADGDGYAACEECDDTSDITFPGADEVCDGEDNDCDDSVDEEAIDASTWYGDADGDGYGGQQFVAAECEQPPGYVDNSDDCNDVDSSAYPGAEEVCDDVDNDCDSEVDEEATEMWYLDSDGDGYGDADSYVEACSPPAGYVDNSDDCDDSSALSSPSSWEVCDGVDNNCDGDVDEASAINASAWYLDVDGDGYGDSSVAMTACDQPSGYVSTGGDCDDSTSDAYPGRAEECDDIDNNCDGSVDEGTAVDASVWYADSDGDGYGDSDSSSRSCDQPSGYVSDDSDCDDGDSSASPGETEVCDFVDNDCDGTVDNDASDATTWYLDGDGDGYGESTSSVESCLQPSGYVSDSGDCDDGDSSALPGGVEVCDLADNDCDGTVDNDASDETTWYLDADGDGYGDDSTTTDSCSAPSGYVAVGGDCDDSDSAYNVTCLDGLTAATAGESCESLLLADSTLTDDTYWIDPDGPSGSTPAFEAACDMTTNGGGWMEVTGELLEDQSWMTFSVVSSGDAGSAYGWTSTPGVFRLDPRGSSCNTVAVRAKANLPFTFDQWFGSWTGTGDQAGSHQDDVYSGVGWGGTTSDCYGHVKFGTDSNTSKQGGEWGVNWSGSTYNPSGYIGVWSWAQESISTTNVIAWEVLDQGPQEEVRFYDISIWVR